MINQYKPWFVGVPHFCENCSMCSNNAMIRTFASVTLLAIRPFCHSACSDLDSYSAQSIKQNKRSAKPSISQWSNIVTCTTSAICVRGTAEDRFGASVLWVFWRPSDRSDRWLSWRPSGWSPESRPQRFFFAVARKTICENAKISYVSGIDYYKGVACCVVCGLGILVKKNLAQSKIWVFFFFLMRLFMFFKKYSGCRHMDLTNDLQKTVPHNGAPTIWMPGINERIAKLLPDGAVMPHNSEMVMVSLDCAVASLIENHQFEYQNHHC